jgi:hypothetical protein
MTGMKACTFMTISLHILLRVRNVSNKCCREKRLILCSTTFFFPDNRVVCKTMWKNMVEPERPQMTIGRMRFTCWITKTTHTLSVSKYVIQIALPRHK